MGLPLPPRTATNSWRAVGALQVVLFASIAGLTGGVADDAGDNRESIAASRESVAGRSARSLAHSGRIMRQELPAVERSSAVAESSLPSLAEAASVVTASGAAVAARPAPHISIPHGDRQSTLPRAPPILHIKDFAQSASTGGAIPGQQQVQQVLTQAVPPGMMQQGMPQAMPQVLPQAMPQQGMMPQAMPAQGMIPQAMPQVMPQMMSPGMPQAMAQGMPQFMPQYYAPPPGYSLVWNGMPPTWQGQPGTMPVASPWSPGVAQPAIASSSQLQAAGQQPDSQVEKVPSLQQSVEKHAEAMPETQHGSRHAGSSRGEEHAKGHVALPLASSGSVRSAGNILRQVPATGAAGAPGAPAAANAGNTSLSQRRRRATSASVPQTASAMSLGSVSSLQPSTANS